MPCWTLVDTHATLGRTFQRPLDLSEVWFFWLGRFGGVADGLEYCQIRLLDGSQDAHLFSEANIVKAWLSTKRRYPLAGATVRGGDGASLRPSESANSHTDNGTGFVSEPHFVVREHDLSILRSGEIIFGSMASAEEAQGRIATIMDGPRPLSEELLMRLYVFRETDPRRDDVLYLMVLVAHCVTDRLAINTFVRCLLDTLARGRDPEPLQIPLEDRLAMTTPSTDHEPAYLRSLSPAIRRWRRAVGTLIYQMRVAKRQGGHTLPCRLTHSTHNIAARSGYVSTSLTQAQTATVIANCRQHGVTFGNAYLALAQVAMTRVLYRRYLRGNISQEEWEYRKRQPFLCGGPLNLRPYLDREWFQKGGGGENMLSLGIFLYELPFMTLGETEKYRHVLSNGAPPFSDLLTFDRFLHRSELVKNQIKSFPSHPLFFEIVRAVALEQIEHTRISFLEWVKRVGTPNGYGPYISSDDQVLPVTDIPMVWAYAGSSAGSLDLMSPIEYPLPSSHPLSPHSSVTHPARAGYVIPPSPFLSLAEAQSSPRIVVESFKIHLRARPAELYLSADSLNGQMNLHVIYDKNVYEDGIILEWLEEVKEAVLWYLGQTHRSRGAQQRHGYDDGKIGRDEGVRAKL